jgi:hypothetical protein
MRRPQLAAAIVVMAAAGIAALPAAAGAATSVKASDVREVPLGKKFSTANLGLNSARARAFAAPAAAATPPVGTVRQWLGLNDTTDSYYRKDYTLRGVGNHIEVWVANDTAFPAGDCRAQIPNSTTITDAQVADLIKEFDTNMYPKETTTFSTPPDRDGTNSIVPPDANGNGGVYTGDGDNTVALIDNVKDDNFFTFPAAPTYIAGFFSATLNELFDRNVMTIDAFDWAHRTGANPPDEPTADLCTSRPARARLYEGTFTHEWQHLLQYYVDPFESTWVNEGISDWAQTLTGYVDTSRTVFDKGADSHIYCFQGFGSVQTPFNPNPRDCGGPENSLNLWGEGNPNAVLADYGNAYSLMQYLSDHFGNDIISRLHRDSDRQGLASLDAQLKAEGSNSLYRVLHNFQSSTLLDKLVGDAKLSVVLGARKSDVTSKSLRASINYANPDINNDPGAAPNGADYVPLQAANGTVLRGRDLRSLSFNGATTLPPLPLLWTSTASDDPAHPGPVLWSGNASNLDASAVIPVTVPTSDPTLRFLGEYGAEEGFDYAYVQVSTDGGATYTSVAGDKTGDAPLGPGLNGSTNGALVPHTYDLSAYAGQSILLAFRYVSDGGVNEGGFRIDDVTLGGTLLSDGSSVAPFKSPTQIRATPVNNWNVRLVGIDEGKVPLVLQVEFNGKNKFSLSRGQLAVASAFQKVVAIVAYDEPTEQVQQYAPYTLTVNGVLQPGGTPAQ